MEKLKPTLDLETIKLEFATVDGLRMTRTAERTSVVLGLDREGVVVLIQSIARSHFYKSMTSFSDHTAWQDVYHVPCGTTIAYVKFTMDEEGHVVLSLKEK